ncbi:hypothetical protein [Sandaracinus amylolyticus]|uniref:hypothetical protein n=1 Tax=Sandaracinus amylolyticus TaxID=927083 RepID=UPI001F465BF9|nr:hypothetical protein [Sandaracinus amylolyticus]
MDSALTPLLATVRARRAARRIAELTDEIDQVLDAAPRWDSDLLALELEALELMVAREIARARRTLERLDASERALASALRRAVEVFDRCARGTDARHTATEWGRCVHELRAALVTSSPVLRSALERAGAARAKASSEPRHTASYGVRAP